MTYLLTPLEILLRGVCDSSTLELFDHGVLADHAPSVFLIHRLFGPDGGVVSGAGAEQPTASACVRSRALPSFVTSSGFSAMTSGISSFGHMIGMSRSLSRYGVIRPVRISRANQCRCKGGPRAKTRPLRALLSAYAYQEASSLPGLYTAGPRLLSIRRWRAAGQCSRSISINGHPCKFSLWREGNSCHCIYSL
jgi:hypothetical protein